MLIIPTIKFFSKNKIQRLRRRWKWHKPRLFLVTKTFTKINQRRRWMAFRVLRRFRRHTILSNKHLLKYIIFLRQFKNSKKYLTNHKIIQPYTYNTIFANLKALKTYTLNRTLIINSLQKRNSNWKLRLFWFSFLHQKTYLRQFYFKTYQYKRFIRKYNQKLRKKGVKKFKAKLTIRKKFRSRVKNVRKIISYLVGQGCIEHYKKNYIINPYYKDRRWLPKHRWPAWFQKWRYLPRWWNKKTIIWYWERIRYFKLKQKYFKKWHHHLKTSNYRKHYKLFIKFLNPYIILRKKYQHIQKKYLKSFYDTISKTFKQNQDPNLLLIRRDIIRIFGYINLKHFLMPSRLKRVFLQYLKLYPKLSQTYYLKLRPKKLLLHQLKQHAKRAHPRRRKKLWKRIRSLQRIIKKTNCTKFVKRLIKLINLKPQRLRKKKLVITKYLRYFYKQLRTNKQSQKKTKKHKYWAIKMHKYKKRKPLFGRWVVKRKKHQNILKQTKNKVYISRILRINRKQFKLNCLMVKTLNIKMPKLKKHVWKQNKRNKFNWYNRAQYLDRQQKRLKYKEKSQTFTPYQYLLIKKIRRLPKFRQYKYKYYKLNLRKLHSLKNYKNIRIAKSLLPIISKRIALYHLYQNKTYSKKLLLYNNLHKKLLKQQRTTFAKFCLPIPYFSPTTLYKLISINNTGNFYQPFNYFIHKIYKKQLRYKKRSGLKTIRKKNHFTTRISLKKLTTKYLMPKSILYIQKYKLKWLKRNRKWRKRKMFLTRRFVLKWHKRQFNKRKSIYKKTNKQTLKTFFIHNVINHQYKNLIKSPTDSSKYLDLMKELFYERWYTAVYNKKPKLEPLYNFLVKKHSKFLQVFHLNPFIFIKYIRHHRFSKPHYKKIAKLYKTIYRKYKKIVKSLKRARRNNKIHTRKLQTFLKSIKKLKLQKSPQEIKTLNYKHKLAIKKSEKEVKILTKRCKKTWKKLKNIVNRGFLIWGRRLRFGKFLKFEQLLANNATGITKAQQQAFTAVRTIKGLYHNFMCFFRYNSISARQRNYFTKKTFINFLLNTYKSIEFNKNNLLHLLDTINVNVRKNFTNKYPDIYFKREISKRVKTEYIKKRKRLNRYRSYQLYSKYRFNKRLFLNRHSRLRYGLTHFLRKWKRVQSIYSQKKFIVKFFLQQYYKGLNPSEFYKMRKFIKFKTNKLEHWYKRIENRADILLAKTKLSSNLWLSRYLITSKKVFFDNKLHTKTNTYFNTTPIITLNTQPINDLIYNVWQNQENNSTITNVPLLYYQKTADTENFLNSLANVKLKRYIQSTVAKSNNRFKIRTSTIKKRKLKFRRPIPFEKRKRRLFFFHKKNFIKSQNCLKKLNQRNLNTIDKLQKHLKFHLPKFLIYRTRRNNKGSFTNLVLHNKYRTTYYNAWYTPYLIHLQTEFNTYNKFTNLTRKFFYNIDLNKFIFDKIKSLTKMNQRQITKTNYPYATIFNTTKHITTNINNTYFDNWRRTFELKLHRRFKRRSRRRPRILRTKFTKTHNNNLLTYDFLNFLRFNKI